MSEIANTPEPPYYAVIFTSCRTDGDNGYGEMADRMVELASKQPGFLGIESARESVGITVSYWADLESIKLWKQNTEHLIAQKEGKDIWYAEFKTRISMVEKDYGFSNNA
ncbi:MAG: antibiotic biosynthesis monooxygenase [Desulfobacteraceae bacterium 4572_187]|nr:MAG: antibiotic biosynthesis monooxygenase [Desulfobacteraceae bacterium 4572_187]